MPEKRQFQKNENKAWRYHHFTLYLWQWHVTDVIFVFIIGLYFSLLHPPPLPPSFNSPKNKKKTWKYHFTQLHQKSWSQAILFLTCLWFWAIFCPFTPITAQKIKIKRKNEKKTWKYHHFTQLYQKSWSHAILFLTYDTWQM